MASRDLETSFLSRSSHARTRVIESQTVCVCVFFYTRDSNDAVGKDNPGHMQAKRASRVDVVDWHTAAARSHSGSNVP